MDVQWELRESGPKDAVQTVLLLPGGGCSAGADAEVMGPPEPAFFRAIVALGQVLGGLPSALLMKGAASMVKRTALPEERKGELRADFAKNVPAHQQPALHEYVQWLRRGDQRADQLCRAGVP